MSSRAWIRTMSKRVKVACATVTPPGNKTAKRKGPSRLPAGGAFAVAAPA